MPYHLLSYQHIKVEFFYFYMWPTHLLVSFRNLWPNTYIHQAKWILIINIALNTESANGSFIERERCYNGQFHVSIWLGYRDSVSQTNLNPGVTLKVSVEMIRINNLNWLWVKEMTLENLGEPDPISWKTLRTELRFQLLPEVSNLHFHTAWPMDFRLASSHLQRPNPCSKSLHIPPVGSVWLVEPWRT